MVVFAFVSFAYAIGIEKAMSGSWYDRLRNVICHDENSHPRLSMICRISS